LKALLLSDRTQQKKGFENKIPNEQADSKIIEWIFFLPDEKRPTKQLEVFI
jgi:hypothetical protein